MPCYLNQVGDSSPYGLSNRLFIIVVWSRLRKRVKINLILCNMLRLFDLGVICYEIKNVRHFLVWLAT